MPRCRDSYWPFLVRSLAAGVLCAMLAACGGGASSDATQEGLGATTIKLTVSSGTRTYPTAFPGASEPPVWSSSPQVSAPSSAWVTSFSNSLAVPVARTATTAVRLVRAIQ